MYRWSALYINLNKKTKASEQHAQVARVISIF